MTGTLQEGLRVLVTGGRSGIGLAIGRAFASNGAHLWTCCTSEAGLQQTLAENPGWHGSVANVAEPEAVDCMFDAVSRELGGLDVLVNNAGIAGPTAPVDAIDVADWDRTLSVNVSGAFHCIRRAVPLFKAQRSGSIINIVTTSVRVGLPNRLPYVASKAAMLGMTRALARELGPYGIRCNAISPGMVDNDRSRRVRRARAASEGITEVELVERRLKFISMRRMVSESEIGAVAVFLASEAARNVTGQNISVCGNVEWE